MKYYKIEERNLPSEIPYIDPQNMGVHIMWMYYNGYRQRAILEMLDLLKHYIKELVYMYSLNYEISEVDFEDLIQEAYMEVMLRMDKYDPQKGKPTTYFKTYIKNRCFTQLGNQFEHISPYYSKIAARLRKAINECVQNNIEYNENKLSAMTGISVHTITQTLNQIKYCTELSLDELDASDEAYMLTPESICMKKEESQIILSAIESLDETEKEILLLKVFGTENNGLQMTLKKIAEVSGYPLDFVKKTLNRAKLKISNEKDMREAFIQQGYEKKHKI